MIEKPRPEEEEGPAQNFPETPEEEAPAEAPAETPAPEEQGEEETPGAPPQDMGEEQSNVSPEEQKQYDQFVDNCYNVIYDQKTLPSILKSLDATDDPKMNLANTVVTVIDFVEKSAREKNMKISGDVLMQGGAEVMGDLADLAGKVGIHDYTEDELEGATYIAMDLYRAMQQKDGTLDVGAAKEDMRNILVADREGRLDDLLPGVQERYGVKQPPAEESADQAPPEEEPVEDEEEV